MGGIDKKSGQQPLQTGNTTPPGNTHVDAKIKTFTVHIFFDGTGNNRFNTKIYRENKKMHPKVVLVMKIIILMWHYCLWRCKKHQQLGKFILKVRELTKEKKMLRCLVWGWLFQIQVGKIVLMKHLKI